MCNCLNDLFEDNGCLLVILAIILIWCCCNHD